MRVVIVGEAMFEYRARSAGNALGYGGDTLNTAIHLARLGAQVQYVTALGTDPLSDALCAQWQAEGIDTRHVLRHPQRQPGIYAIHNDPEGERSFLYWRDQSAAREMFALPGMTLALRAIGEAELLYYSLITLAILPESARRSLLDASAALRTRGGRFAYDGNYRASLWPDRQTALRCSIAAVEVADIGLPTWSDEVDLRQQTQHADAVAKQWLAEGAVEVAVKTGVDGCVIGAAIGSNEVAPPQALDVVDSSGAGDAFNAGYLFARLRGQDRQRAALCGHHLAGWVIQRPGAIPPIDGDAPYAQLMHR